MLSHSPLASRLSFRPLLYFRPNLNFLFFSFSYWNYRFSLRTTYYIGRGTLYVLPYVDLIQVSSPRSWKQRKLKDLALRPRDPHQFEENWGCRGGLGRGLPPERGRRACFRPVLSRCAGSDYQLANGVTQVRRSWLFPSTCSIGASYRAHLFYALLTIEGSRRPQQLDPTYQQTLVRLTLQPILLRPLLRTIMKEF